MKNQFACGSISILVLLVGVTIAVAVGGLAITAMTLYTDSARTEAFEKSLSIAQSGTEYYRWHLSHAAADYTDGTGHAGPYIHAVSDPYGNTEGTFSLTITPPSSGSAILTITSQGWINSYPDIKRTVRVKYGIPSLAKFSFLNNANMWFGQKDEVHGKVFSNGGIRMDGTHDSTVESAKSTYTCGIETGCTTPTPKPGIWGDGGPQALWRYPVSSIDFNTIALDFGAMKTAAQTNGVYLAASGVYGYHIVFSPSGTFQVYTVDTTDSEKGWSVEKGCETLYEDIKKETLIGTYSVSQKPIVFAEDTLWVEGTVNGKITVVAARFPLDTNMMNIWIPNNILYAAKDGNSDLGLIAQNDIYMAVGIPQKLEIDAALLAHRGHVIRHNYKYSGCGHSNDAVRQELYIYGSIISNLKSYWSYGQGGAGFGSSPTSGFSQRVLIYDPALYYTPPPYMPTLGQYEFISWEEY